MVQLDLVAQTDHTATLPATNSALRW